MPRPGTDGRSAFAAPLVLRARAARARVVAPRTAGATARRLGLAHGELCERVVTALNPDVAIAGILWLALGIAIYAVYRHRHGLDLKTTAKIVVPKPVTATEAETVLAERPCRVIIESEPSVARVPSTPLRAG